MTTKHQVIDLHRLHPEWNSVQIANHLDCEDSYVRATFKRNGLQLAGRKKSPIARERERCAAVAVRLGAPEIAAEIMGAA